MEKYTIRELRARNRYTQKDLADKVGVSSMTIYNFESDVDILKRIKYSMLEDIAKALDVEVEDIDMDRI